MNDLSFNKALLSVWELVGALNRYIDTMQPWALAKDAEQKGRLGTVLYTAVDGLRALSYFIAPFMPESAAKLRAQIGLSADISLSTVTELGATCKMPTGGSLNEVVALFPRIDEREMMAALTQEQKPATAPTEATAAEVEPIVMADFEKIRIIAGKVEAAEKVVKSEKLLRLSVNDGAGIRTIVSGIAKSYEPAELVGKTVAILENLKPAKLMGIESRGMVLAAFDGEKHHVVILPDTVPAGTKIK
jgi:methionyl-tRNA synthetase